MQVFFHWRRSFIYCQRKITVNRHAIKKHTARKVLEQKNSEREIPTNWSMETSDKVPVSDASVSLVIPTVAKSNRDQCFIPARITNLGRMKVHRRDTSTLIAQLRVYSVCCRVHRETCLRTMSFPHSSLITGIEPRIFCVWGRRTIRAGLFLLLLMFYIYPFSLFNS